MNVPSVGGSDFANSPVYFTRPRGSVRSSESSVQFNSPSQTNSIPQSSDDFTRKLDEVSQVQHAFSAAMKMGEDIERSGLLAPLQ